MAWPFQAALACLLAAAGAASGAAAQELLDNPGFLSTWTYPVNANGGNISGTLVGGWGDNTDWVGPDVRIKYAPQSGAACGGGYKSCVRATVTGPFMQFGQFGLKLAPGTAYRLSIWLRAQAPSGSRLNGVVASLRLRQAGEPYQQYGQANAVVGSTWRQLSIPMALLPANSSRASPPPLECFFHIQAGQGTLWIANASLAQLRPGEALPTVSLAPPRGVPVPRSYVGLHASGLFGNTWFWDKPLPFALNYAWPGLDFGVLRTWDSGVMWATIQPDRRGSFNWTMLDYMVASAQVRAQKLIFTLGQTPAWAARRPLVQATYGLGLGSPPQDLRDWTAFVTALVRRYKGRIHAYETWNEPDLQGEWGFFNGSPQDLVRLEEATADVLAAEDPAAALLTPPTSGGDVGGALEWTVAYLAAGGGRRAQAAAWHAYVAAPEAAISVVDTLREVLAAYGLQRLPLWNTEGGLPLGPGGFNSTASAGFVARSLVVYWALRMPVSCWYSYGTPSEYEGLVELVKDSQGQGDPYGRPGRLTAAGLAYRQVTSWLLGASMASLTSRPDGIWVAELQRASSDPLPSKSWIVWSPRGPAQLPLPLAWGAASWQDGITGRVAAISGGSRVPVGEVPLLVF